MIQFDICNEVLPDIKSNQIFQFNIVLDNELLEEFALNLETKQSDNNIHYSNIGGWHSTTDLFKSSKHPEICKLQKTILNCADKILKKKSSINLSWVNINRKGHKNKNHSHGSRLAACYYVVTDNRGGEFLATDLGERLSPNPGTLLIFPGNMYHQVLPYTGNHHRISIACNIHQ